MAVVRCANAPVIIRTITEQLDYEHKVVKGEAQRKPVNKTFFDFLYNWGINFVDFFEKFIEKTNLESVKL